LPKTFSNSKHFDFQPDIDVALIFHWVVLNIKQVWWTSQSGFLSVYLLVKWKRSKISSIRFAFG